MWGGGIVCFKMTRWQVMMIHWVFIGYHKRINHTRVIGQSWFHDCNLSVVPNDWNHLSVFVTVPIMFQLIHLRSPAVPWPKASRLSQLAEEQNSAEQHRRCRAREILAPGFEPCEISLQGAVRDSLWPWRLSKSKRVVQLLLLLWNLDRACPKSFITLQVAIETFETVFPQACLKIVYTHYIIWFICL